MDVLDGLVRQIFGQRVILLAALWYFHFNRLVALVKRGLPLVRFTTDEPVKVVKALHCGPAIKWTGYTGLPVRNVVILAKKSCAVTVLAQDFGEHRFALWNLAAVAGITTANFGDNPRPCGMMVATCQQCGTCGRTKRRRMKA